MMTGSYGRRASSNATWWFLLALALSLALHYGFLAASRQIPFMRFIANQPEPEATEPFKVQFVDPLPRKAVEQYQEIPAKAQHPEAPETPEDRPSASQLPENVDHQLPAAPELSRAILEDKPDILSPSTYADAFQAAIPRSDAPLQRMLAEDKPTVPVDKLSMTSRALPAARQDQEIRSGGGVSQGFSNLDELLAQTGPLRPETAPILMPTDVLFEYDQYQLRYDAIDSLNKLGALIRKNPQAIFLIEGHTDSFGPDEYNLSLSKYRAESVKQWLVSNMGIQPSQIETRGLGKTRPIVPTSGTVEEQRLNRRVEIVIRTRN